MEPYDKHGKEKNLFVPSADILISAFSSSRSSGSQSRYFWISVLNASRRVRSSDNSDKIRFRSSPSSRPPLASAMDLSAAAIFFSTSETFGSRSLSCFFRAAVALLGKALKLKGHKFII